MSNDLPRCPDWPLRPDLSLQRPPPDDGKLESRRWGICIHRPRSDRQRRVLYIGETYDLNARLPGHPKWQQAVAMGANWILARAVRGHTTRYGRGRSNRRIQSTSKNRTAHNPQCALGRVRPTSSSREPLICHCAWTALWVVERRRSRLVAPAGAKPAAVGPRQPGSNQGIAQVAAVWQLHIGINPLPVLVRLDS
jgi:hypothetical protein